MSDENKARTAEDWFKILPVGQGDDVRCVTVEELQMVIDQARNEGRVEHEYNGMMKAAEIARDKTEYPSAKNNVTETPPDIAGEIETAAQQIKDKQ